MIEAPRRPAMSAIADPSGHHPSCPCSDVMACGWMARFIWSPPMPIRYAIWSNAQVEAHLTELKLVERQMYWRAKLDFLQARLVGVQ